MTWPGSRMGHTLYMTPKAAPKSAITARVRQNRWRTERSLDVEHLFRQAPAPFRRHDPFSRRPPAMGLFGPSTKTGCLGPPRHRPFAWRGSRTDVLRATFYGLELALAEPGIWSA